MVARTGRPSRMNVSFIIPREIHQVADAKAKGAEFLCGGDWDGASRMIPPMVVDGLTDDILHTRTDLPFHAQGVAPLRGGSNL